MASPGVNYQSLKEDHQTFKLHDPNSDIESLNENEETPRNSGVMIHTVPETNKARWNHIEDLDSFFTRMYNYHQAHGFAVIILDETLQLFEFAFVAWFIAFNVHCIRYDILFGTDRPTSKVTIGEVVVPMAECVTNFGATTFCIMFIATFYFMFRLTKFVIHITQYSDIKKFYSSALNIEDENLDNITWHEVKKRIRAVQSEQHMCIDKDQLTELDIYHRILRFTNYKVALMNNNLLPVRYKLPLLGEFVSLSQGLMYNIDFILFRGPGSPFLNNWQLRDDYTVRSNQTELAQRLSNLILWVALANFILSPIIFFWQLINFIFSYANILRKEPGALGMRTWSNYGRLYLRHFNELDHELDARLNRAYEYADRYLTSFSSPLCAVIAKNILFLSGGVLVVLLALGIYDEFVFQVEHVLTIITLLSVIGLVARVFIPAENLIWCPEQLMTAILAHVHYLPSDWKSQAHTSIVRKEFSNIFQFKAEYLVNEICSPLITPFILIFVFRPKAPEIVKFFRSFTVSVRGVGNVCSFAQMDVRKNGNPDWQIQNFLTAEPTLATVPEENKRQNNHPVDNGKIELSLIRFTLTNPEWQMPPDARTFIKGIHHNAVKDLVSLKPENNCRENPMTESLLSFGTMGEEYSSITNSVFHTNNIQSVVMGHSLHQSKTLPGQVPLSTERGSLLANDFDQMLLQNLEDLSRERSTAPETSSNSQSRMTINNSLGSMRKMRVFKVEGRLEGPNEALLYNICGQDSQLPRNPTDVTIADMCLSTLYLHELHRKNKLRERETNTASTSSRRRAQALGSASAAENTPLLKNVNS